MPIGIALAVIRAIKLPLPVVTSGDTITLTVDQVMTNYQITGSNSPTSYDCSTLPLGLTINKNTGVISGTPTAIGTTVVTISAINLTGPGTKDLTIIVLPQKPVVTSDVLRIFIGVPLINPSYKIKATNNPTSYESGTLPDGLNLDKNTGLISGTPTTLGSTNVQIRAKNAGGLGSANLTITVDAVKPKFTNSILDVTVTVNELISPIQIFADNTPTSYGASPLPNGLTVDTNTGKITGTPTTVGDYTVSISATNTGGTDTATLIIHVVPKAPVITNTLLSLTLPINVAMTNYQITGTNSPNRFNAAPLPKGLVVNSFNGIISGTPTELGVTNVIIAATNAGGIGVATLIITVVSPPPVINSALSLTLTVGKTMTNYIITASNNPILFDSVGLPNGLSLDKNTGIISGIPTLVGVSNVNISASNSGGTDNKTLVITVIPEAPVITNTDLNLTLNVGIIMLPYQITATNRPTGFATSLLPAGLTCSVNGLITGTPTKVGVTNVNICASNAGGSGCATLTITVLDAKPVVTNDTITITVNELMSYQIDATNSPSSYGVVTPQLPTALTIDVNSGLITGTPITVGTTTVTINAGNAGGTGTGQLIINVIPKKPTVLTSSYKLVVNKSMTPVTVRTTNNPTSFTATNLNVGLSIDNTGKITGTPTAINTSGQIVIITATNAGGTGTGKLLIKVVPDPPVINSSLTSIWQQGSNGYSYQITATNNPTSFTAVGLPNGLQCSTNGLITGTPVDGGVFNVTLNATNAGGTGTDVLILTIAWLAPVITSPFVASEVAGNTFTYVIAATNSPISYGATNLPAGLSFAGMTITGICNTPGTYQVTITATNGGGTDSKILVLTIKVPAPVVSGNSITLTKNTAASYQIAATNNPTSYYAIGLPNGLTYNASSGIISGTPLSIGTTDVTIGATNGSGTGTAHLFITIIDATPVVTAKTIAVKNGDAVSVQIEASNSPTNYSITTGNLGLIFNDKTGLITGKFTGTNGVNYSCNMIASNTNPVPGFAALTINTPPDPPTPTYPVNIEWTVNIPGFAAQIGYIPVTTAPPTAWTMSNVPGLSISNTGLITGTPTAVGTYLTTVTCTNAGGTGSFKFTIFISKPVPTVSGPTTVTVTEGKSIGPLSYSATDGPILSWSSSGLTNGLAFSNGVVSGVITTLGFDRTTTLQIQAINSTGMGFTTLTVTILKAVVAPTFTSVSLRDSTFSKASAKPSDFIAVNGGTPFTLTITGMPTGLRQSPSNQQVIEGSNNGAIPSTAPTGAFTVTITVTNSGGTTTGTKRLIITA